MNKTEWIQKEFKDQHFNDVCQVYSGIIKKKNPKDDFEFIEKNIEYILGIVHTFANDPLTTQEEILKKLSISKKLLLDINKIIRNTDDLQELILKKGSGERYWNSILPFSKYTDDVIKNNFNLPIRIAFFPGVSCMFYCGFCGRNQDAKYPSDIVRKGIDNLKSIINEVKDSKSTAISISGGLEPLTNPYLGEFISHAKNSGMRVPLITNAYSLTESYVKKNSGLWDLDSLRVSLYGVDKETYNFVTRSPKSYKMVSNNLINFLKTKIEKKSNLKVGLNFIILKENIDDIKKLCEFIHYINSESNSEINFLTLREDFGSVTGHSSQLDIERKYRLEGFLNLDDRQKLKNELHYLEDYKKKYFPNLNIDYGYALKGLVNDKIDYYLVRANDDEVTKRGYPQLSVAIDLFGDVFLYREAGFLNREGNEDYIIGRTSEKDSLKKIISNHLNQFKEKKITNSTRFLDSFDHLITKLVSQAQKDFEFGIPFKDGPVKLRSENVKIDLGNNWYS